MANDYPNTILSFIANEFEEVCEDINPVLTLVEDICSQFSQDKIVDMRAVLKSEVVFYPKELLNNVDLSTYTIEIDTSIAYLKVDCILFEIQLENGVVHELAIPRVYFIAKDDYVRIPIAARVKPNRFNSDLRSMLKINKDHFSKGTQDVSINLANLLQNMPNNNQHFISIYQGEA